MPADAPVVEVGLGGVDSHQRDAVLADDVLAGGEQALEMRVADVAAVVVAGHHQHVRAVEPVEVLPGFAEFLAVPHVGQIARDDHHVGGQVVHLHQRPVEQVGHEVLRARVQVGQVGDDAGAGLVVHLDFLRLEHPAAARSVRTATGRDKRRLLRRSL